MRPVGNFGNLEKAQVQSSCFITRYFIWKTYNMVPSANSYM